MTNRRTYTAEFKRDAVRLDQSTENITSAARDLGIGLSTLRKWMKAAQDAGEQAFPGQGRPALTTERIDREPAGGNLACGTGICGR